MKQRLKLFDRDDDESYEAVKKRKFEREERISISSSGNSLTRALTVHGVRNVAVFGSFFWFFFE